MKKTIILCFIFVLSLNLFAWKPLTIKYMVVESYKTFPSGLRFFLDDNRKDIIKGVESLNKSDFKGEKDLRKFICKESKKIEKMIKKRKKISDIAFEFGRLYKAIALISYPFHFEDSFFAKDYENYVNSKLDKYIFAFSPETLSNLKKKSCNDLIESLYKESIELRGKILRDYKIYDNSSNFDDLSAAFGSGSLMFSNTCFTISAISGKIWGNVNGSMEGFLIVKKGER